MVCWGLPGRHCWRSCGLLQLVRYDGDPADPSQRSQQRIFDPAAVLALYGWWLPAGLFIYGVTTTISIVQQHHINMGPLPALSGDARRGEPSPGSCLPHPRLDPTRAPAATQVGPLPAKRSRPICGWTIKRPAGEAAGEETPMTEHQEFTGKTNKGPAQRARVLRRHRA
jgi:hypothetical protein